MLTGKNPEFEFRTENDGTLSMESAVFQALGAASMCWEDMSKAGVFDSQRCRDIGDKLVAWLRDNNNAVLNGEARPEPTAKQVAEYMGLSLFSTEMTVSDVLDARAALIRNQEAEQWRDQGIRDETESDA